MTAFDSKQTENSLSEFTLSLSHSFVPGDGTVSAVPKHKDYREKGCYQRWIFLHPQPLHSGVLCIPITTKNSIVFHTPLHFSPSPQKQLWKDKICLFSWIYHKLIQMAVNQSCTNNMDFWGRYLRKGSELPSLISLKVVTIYKRQGTTETMHRTFKRRILTPNSSP